MKKISSVLELARYKIDDTVWWVTLRFAQKVQKLGEDEEWMFDVHPKTLYEGPYKHTWPFRSKLPKLHHSDFVNLVSILASEFVIEQFKIREICRSPNTGEFYYANADDEWMPESYLCDTKEAAIKERDRIFRLIKNWMQRLQ